MMLNRSDCDTSCPQEGFQGSDSWGPVFVVGSQGNFGGQSNTARIWPVSSISTCQECEKRPRSRFLPSFLAKLDNVA